MSIEMSKFKAGQHVRINIKLDATGKPVEKRRFTVEFEVDAKAWDYWKNNPKKTDEKYVEELIRNALSNQGDRMSR